MSYLNALRVDYDEIFGWQCPDGMTPCSENKELGDPTVCVDSTQTCPVTDLLLLTGDSNDHRLNDASYTIKEGIFGAEKLYLVYTSSSNERSNSPLQSLTWELNSLCAFADQANVVKNTASSPVYYPLEAATDLEDCQHFYATEADEDTQVAEDKRYTNVA